LKAILFSTAVLVACVIVAELTTVLVLSVPEWLIPLMVVFVVFFIPLVCIFYSFLND
jgi:hypothetical protein